MLNLEKEHISFVVKPHLPGLEKSLRSRDIPKFVRENLERYLVTVLIESL